MLEPGERRTCDRACVCTAGQTFALIRTNTGDTGDGPQQDPTLSLRMGWTSWGGRAALSLPFSSGGAVGGPRVGLREQRFCVRDSSRARTPGKLVPPPSSTPHKFRRNPGLDRFAQWRALCGVAVALPLYHALKVP